jgi:acetyltransferase-like isoleucine patch superfamily enzyme
MSNNAQLRKHLKRTFRVRLRSFIERNRIKSLGKNVYIDKDVELLRYPKNISISDNVVLKSGARICSCNESSLIHIGESTTVGHHTFIFASEGVDIGANCLIAPFVYIVDSDHQIRKSKRINEQGNLTAPIKIDDDVWIGTGAKILKGVTINKGAIIAAGAVVKDDVLPYSIVGGIPAKEISKRV